MESLKKSIERLKNFWDGAPTAQNLEVAVDLLGTLASCAPLAEAVVAEGFIPRLVEVLNGEVSGGENNIAAAKAVNELGFNSKTIRKDLGRLRVYSSSSDNVGEDEKEAAAKALSNLLQCTSNNKRSLKRMRGVYS